MANNAEAIEPISFVQEQYPELILSSDIHDLQGAVACAEYLGQQQPGTRSSKNLISSSQDTLNDQDLIDLCSGKDALSFEASTAARRLVIRAAEKAFSPVFRYHTKVARAVGLFSLTQYKVEAGEPLDTQQITKEYEQLMEITSGFFSRGFIKQVWLERHYKDLLAAKRPLSQAELASAQAGLDVCKAYTRNPLAKGDFMLDQWRINRRLKRAAA